MSAPYLADNLTAVKMSGKLAKQYRALVSYRFVKDIRIRFDDLAEALAYKPGRGVKFVKLQYRTVALPGWEYSEWMPYTEKDSTITSEL